MKLFDKRKKPHILSAVLTAVTKNKKINESKDGYKIGYRPKGTIPSAHSIRVVGSSGRRATLTGPAGHLQQKSAYQEQAYRFTLPKPLGLGTIRVAGREEKNTLPQMEIGVGGVLSQPTQAPPRHGSW